MNEIDGWIAQLQSAGSADARAKAAEELGEFGGAAAAAALRQALTDPTSAVRVSAALALGELRDAGASELLLPLLSSAEPNERGAAAVALGQIGGHAAALLALRRDPSAAVRGALAWALGTLGDPQARETLAALAMDADPEVADAAREAQRKLV